MKKAYMRVAQLHDPKEGEETGTAVEGSEGATEAPGEPEGAGELVD